MAKYREDIDGLRAVAVLAVLVFHAFPSVLPGGFIGVDIFFVISGFLITRIIAEKLDRGEFSLIEFYYRRMKRIFPALVLVLLCTSALGWMLLLPPEFRYLGGQIFSGAIFLANFKFWREAGYFDTASDTKPLLHLWSLAVEEQFYLVWPLLLWVAWRYRFNGLKFVLGLVVVSFAINVMLVHAGLNDAAFYSPVSRFWELLGGAALAVCRQVTAPSRAVANAASLAGAALVALGLVSIDPSSKFPGWWALFPVAGATLLIWAGSSAVVNRLVLSNRLAVGIGLISYPLYLWHWPLLSLAAILEDGTPPVEIRAVILALSAVLALVTYLFVERPIRFGSANPFAMAGALTVALAGVAVFGFSAYRGTPEGMSPRFVVNVGEVTLEGGHDEFFRRQLEGNHLCTPKHLHERSLKAYWPARCVQSKPSEKRDVAIVGDSHAEDLVIGLSEALPATNVVGYIHSLPTIATPGLSEIFDHVVSDPNIKIVIMTAFWNFHADLRGNTFDLRGELSATLDRLMAAGKVVYLIEGRPSFPADALACKYVRPQRFWQTPRVPKCELSLTAFEQQRRRHREILLELADKFDNVHVLSVANLFCNEGSCRMDRNGHLLFRDSQHLSVEGSRIVGAAIAPQLDTLGLSAGRAGSVK